MSEESKPKVKWVRLGVPFTKNAPRHSSFPETPTTVSDAERTAMLTHSLGSLTLVQLQHLAYSVLLSGPDKHIAAALVTLAHALMSGPVTDSDEICDGWLDDLMDNAVGCYPGGRVMRSVVAGILGVTTYFPADEEDCLSVIREGVLDKFPVPAQVS